VSALAILTVLLVAIPFSMKNVWMQRISMVVIGSAWYYAFATLFAVFKSKNGYYPFNVDILELLNQYAGLILRTLRRK
jgi:hypothetical protein